MNTENIMRGDWLYYKGKLNAFPFQVEQVTKKKFGYHAEPDENRMHYLRPCECQPIPLTEDIIKRQYFNPDEIGWWPEGNEFFFDFGKNRRDVSISLKYVHELQHAFKLCGIDKKIELY